MSNPMTVDLVGKTADDLASLVLGLRAAVRERDERIARLLAELNRVRKSSLDSLPEIDPYDR